MKGAEPWGPSHDVSLHKAGQPHQPLVRQKETMKSQDTSFSVDGQLSQPPRPVHSSVVNSVHCGQVAVLEPGW